MGSIAFFGILGNADGISHITHIAGMVVGYTLLKKSWRWKDFMFAIRKKTIEYQVQRSEEKLTKTNVYQRDIDKILEKIQEIGFSELSEKEKNKLYEASKKMSKSRQWD
tara:strand:- start:973 stop:1299 length:327 start_codon:yes stop_codon:yes gene_type:complete